MCNCIAGHSERPEGREDMIPKCQSVLGGKKKKKNINPKKTTSKNPRNIIASGSVSQRTGLDVDPPPRGHLKASGNRFGGQDWEEEGWYLCLVARGYQGCCLHPTRHRTAPQQRRSSPTCHRANAENFWSQDSILVLHPVYLLRTSHQFIPSTSQSLLPPTLKVKPQGFPSALSA